jgi:hypothetical protein
VLALGVWHSPLASQQPAGQLVEEHVAEVGPHAAVLKPNATPITAEKKKFRFMGGLSFNQG